MGDGSGDSQKIWHCYVGDLIKGSTILDVGSGLGNSKFRLGRNGNVVTTQDINRAYMNYVDTIKPIELLSHKWDYVTAFDVVEHVYDPTDFIDKLVRLAKMGIFATTPNKYIVSKDWHYSPLEFSAMFPNKNLRWFLRYKGPNFDEIEEVRYTSFVLNETAMALGILCIIE